MMRAIFAVLFPTFLSIACVNSQDPCVHFEFINVFNGERNAYSATGPGSTINDEDIIDKDQTTWYRFQHDTGGDRLADSCVDLYFCGTTSPAWLNGAHPSEAQGTVERMVCINDGWQGNCCKVSFTILVRKCPASGAQQPFFVYQLKLPPDFYIDFAYCTSAEEITDTPTSSPCPGLSRSPHLGGPHISTGPYVQFTCTIYYDGDTTGQEGFDVTWLFDGMADPMVPVVQTDPGTLEIVLQEQQLAGRMGKAVSCSVAAYFLSTPTIKCGNLRSNSYWMGIVLVPDRLEIQEGTGAESIVKSTMPIICPDVNRECHIRARVRQPNMAVSERCEIEITREDWVQEESHAYHRMKALQVYAPNGPNNHQDRLFEIQFDPVRSNMPPSRVALNGSPYPNIWTNYQIQPLPVAYRDGPYRVCSSTGDPHLTTFDGKYFHVYDVGQFLFWKSTTHIFEVHVRHFLCRPDKAIACNCAVAVREGNAVLGISACRGSLSGPPSVTLFKNPPPLPQGASITRDATGTKYTINLPSGRYVTVQTYRGSRVLNIYAYAIYQDRSSTEGLCGNNDGDKTNDLAVRNTNPVQRLNLRDGSVPVQFSNSYRIPRGESLFDSPYDDDSTVADRFVDVCTCHDGDSVSIQCGQVEPPTTGSGNPTTTIMTEPRLNNIMKQDPVRDPVGRRRRRKRQTPGSPAAGRIPDDDAVDIASEPFDYGENFQHGNFDWPTASGITESQARAACQSATDSLPAYADCEAEMAGNFDKGNLIEECTIDIMIMDTLDVTKEIGATFEEKCLAEVMKDPNKYKPNDAGDFELASQWTMLMCPGQCGGQGTCKNGKCQCNSGYEGPGCTLSPADNPKPQILEVGLNGLCDVSEGKPCHNVYLIANGIYDTPKLSCQVLHQKTGAKETTMAKFQSYNGLTCQLPSHNVGSGASQYDFILTISRDGTTFSDPAHLTVHDSLCMECTVNSIGMSANCIKKSGTCLIGGNCYSDGEVNPDNNCESCVTSISESGWNQLQENLPPQITSDKSIFKLPDEAMEIQLKASDPNDQTLSFTLQLPQLAGVSLTSDGKLTVASSSGTGQFTVKVDDGCSLSDTKTFSLSIYVCPCQNGGSCIAQLDQPRGQGHYNCNCPAYYRGDLCDIIDRVECSQTVVPENIQRTFQGEWCGWADWSTCSKTCDIGLWERFRRCLGPPCNGDSKNYTLCNTNNCPEDDQEAEHLVKIEIASRQVINTGSSTTVSKVVLKESGIIGKIQSLLAKMCLSEPRKCCNPIDPQLGVRGPRVMTAKGYPTQHESNSVILGIVAFWASDEYKSMCILSRQEEREKEYLDNHSLRDIILANEATIEKAFNITIKSVTVDKNPSILSLPLWQIVLIAIGILIILVVIIVMAYYSCKKGKTAHPTIPGNDTAQGSQPNIVDNGDYLEIPEESSPASVAPNEAKDYEKLNVETTTGTEHTYGELSQ